MRGKVSFKKILGIIVIGYVTYILINQQLTINKINKNLLSTKDQLQKLKDENVQLQDKVQMSRTDEYAEKLAREKDKLTKQNETTVLDK
ncbi:MAG: septum formation initiator family protein [Clostridiaceae bacterium]